MKPINLLTILAVATLPFLVSCVSEAERAQRASEEARQAKIAAQEELKEFEKTEKNYVRCCLEKEIFPSEQKLSEEDRSRGWAILEGFGDEQMPILAEQCKTARRNCLEAEANLKELVTALKAEDPNFNPDSEKNESSRRRRDRDAQKVNPIFDAAKNRWLDLAAEYWWLRYKLTDFYSQFKIGTITSDELAAKDAEFAKE